MYNTLKSSFISVYLNQKYKTCFLYGLDDEPQSSLYYLQKTSQIKVLDWIKHKWVIDENRDERWLVPDNVVAHHSINFKQSRYIISVLQVDTTS